MKLPTRPNRLHAVIWFLIISVSIYYIQAKCFRYFVFTPKNYHEDFFWPRRNTLFIHIVSGIIATVVSPFQFISYIRNNYTRLHRIIGKTYIYSIVVSSITSFYLCATTPENIYYALGLTGFTAAWLFTAVMGVITVRKGLIEQHKAWMVRCFVVTIGFSISRLLEDILIHMNAGGTRVERLTVLSWVSWIVPLIITELVLQKIKIKKYRLIPA